MKNKILIQLLVPDIGEEYNVYIPINKKIGNIIVLLTKAINEFESEIYDKNNQNCLYNGKKYKYKKWNKISTNVKGEIWI